MRDRAEDVAIRQRDLRRLHQRRTIHTQSVKRNPAQSKVSMPSRSPDPAAHPHVDEERRGRRQLSPASEMGPP
jgi:hypothetical protein